MDQNLVELFTGCSVEELQKLVRSKRHDVERKKDELRHLVGERHRDVIEASDAIQEMKNLVNNASGSIKSIKARCASLNISPYNISSFTGNSRLTDLSVAAHLKLLLDLPEMIWHFMDNADHISAVILFFLGRHISARLQLSSQPHSVGIDARVLVKRLWNSLVHMESAVLTACRRRLNAPPSSWKELCNSLVSVILLENIPLPKAMDEFLNGRMVALRRIFSGNENPLSSQEGARSDYSTLPIRRQAVLASKLLISTLNTAEFLFIRCPGDNALSGKGALQCKLEELKRWNLQDTKWLPAEYLYTYLSEDVRKFSLADAMLRKRSGNTSSDVSNPLTITDDLDLPALQERLAQWWTQALDYCRDMLVTSLSHSPKLGTVIHTRYVVLSLTRSWQKTDRPESDDRMLAQSSSFDPEQLWFQAGQITDTAKMSYSHPLLQRSVDLWTELFRDPFLTHITTLVNSNLDDYFDEWVTCVLRLVNSTSDPVEFESGKGKSEMGQTVWSPFAKLSPDWAKYVWADSKIDSFCVGDLNTAVPHGETNIRGEVHSTANLTRILRPDNVGLVVFCCLTGLPFPDSIGFTADNSVHSPLSPPAHLLVFLQRLISDSDTTKHIAPSSEQSHMPKPPRLSDQLTLTSPTLQSCCETLNMRIADLIVQVVQNAGQDWPQLWAIILESMQRLLNRCEQWILSYAYETQDSSPVALLSSALSPFTGLVLSRACSAFIDRCSAIGAAIITAVGVAHSNKICATQDSCDNCDELRSKRAFTWSDVNFLHSVWLKKREPLQNLADRLTLDCLLKATVQGPPLIEFRDCTQSVLGIRAFAATGSVASSQLDDDQLLIYDCLADEPDLFNVGLDFVTVPFDEVRLKSDSSPVIDGDETVDHDAVAVLRVPSQISLPLHRALLSVAHVIVRLVSHTTLRPGSRKTFCYTLCDTLLTEYMRITEQLVSAFPSELDGSLPSTKSAHPNGLVTPRALQLTIDTQFLIKLLIGSQKHGQNSSKGNPNEIQRNSQLEQEVLAKAKQLLSRLETLVDPFDWEVFCPRLSSAVSSIFNGIAHLYAPLLCPGVGLPISTNKVSEVADGKDSSAAEFKSAAPTLMPLMTGHSRSSFAMLPLGLSTCFDKRRSKTFNTARAKMAHGQKKPSEVNASTIPKSSALSTVVQTPVSGAGFMHLGSMWFAS